MNFEFSRISKTNLTSVKYSKRHFLNHPACFFLEQTTDRKIELLISVLRLLPQCTALQLLAEPLQNKICHTLHAKFTPFSCFPIICLPAIWKSFFFLRNRSYLRHYLLNVIPTFCQQLLLLANYSLVYFMKV